MAERLSTADIRDIRRYAFQNPHMSTARMAKIFNLREEDVRTVVNEQPKQSEPARKGKAGGLALHNAAKERCAKILEYWLQNPKKTPVEVSRHFGLNDAYVTNSIGKGLLVLPPEFNPPRHVVAAPRVEAVKRSCPDCGTELVKGAKFCWNCGHKIVTKRGAVIAGVEKVLYTISALYPVGSREMAVRALNDAIDYIEKNTEEE